MNPRPANPLIVALDVPDLPRAEVLAGELAGEVALLKVGLELFCAHGPDAVHAIGRHAPVFLDLKLHDIPNTVAGAARRCGALGVAMLTVHASGGSEMIAAAVRGAREGAEGAGVAPPSIIAVTVLSSLGEGSASSVALAATARDAGADGAVVSGPDVAAVRSALGRDAALVVPGIRPNDAPAHDQVRVLTPMEAVAAGADWLVVGRPITGARNPAAAARALVASAR